MEYFVFLNSFHPKIKKFIQRFDHEIGRNKVSLLFNQVYIYIYIYILGGTLGVMNIVMEMVMTIFQIIDEAVCISHSIDTLWKGMDQTILPPVMGKIVG